VKPESLAAIMAAVAAVIQMRPNFAQCRRVLRHAIRKNIVGSMNDAE
jgi:hypothetical protein